MENKILDLINRYWKFDDNQHPVSTWHDKQDLMEAVRKVFDNGDLNCDHEWKREKFDILRWQTRDEMRTTTNPLQRIAETFAFTPRDCGQDKMIAFLYGIALGWDNASYKELKKMHGWSDEDVILIKAWHKNYKKAWNLFVEYCT